MRNPTKSYFICFTVRSGSSLLCQLLAETNLAGKPQEHFHHNVTPDNPAGDAIFDYAGYVQGLFDKWTTPNGVFGAKVGGGQWRDTIRRIRTIDGYQDKSPYDAIHDLFPNLHYIWLTRRNKIRQAVSHWMAIQSGRWGAFQSVSNPDPEYNFEAIDTLAQELLFREAVWADYFADNDIVPHVVVYEDYTQNTVETVRKVFDFLNIDLPDGFVIPEPKYQRLANSLSEDWVERYSKEKQESWWTTFY